MGLICQQQLPPLYRIFDSIGSMETQPANQIGAIALSDSCLIPAIFAKYTSGGEQLNMPFKLFEGAPAPVKLARGGVRGPYRRYTPQEKQAIIDRMMQGVTLKRIAEETRIPKRNLIRWKHEHLRQQRESVGEEQESVVLESASPVTKPSNMSTKQTLSELAIEVELSQ